MEYAKRILLYFLGLSKSIIFNFYYFPPRQAIRLPVLVSHRVWLMKLSGVVELSATRTGAVKIGFGEVGIFDQHKSRTIWQVSGIINFNGRANIGHGSKLSVTGSLTVGENFVITAESAIVSHSSIIIGDDVLVSWDSLIIDTDFHRILDANGAQTNNPAPITIGNRVWIGCRTLILKEVTIADGVVIGAASTVSKYIATPGAMAAGSPARVVKQGVHWKQ